ncbi:TFIIH and nucleotide excision repair factor 3 complexes subunit (Tfb2), putative [Cordyceps militaris CM01]|uniref:RNA polymerase II transcription factor B subunit 2 n=1 Tax=Cordyceps militaris (strain CM01) TaxID=983644 RepID=G3JEH9_CORMM|nr:TFIIH and nucleotide excision repair factor 3 complexes subunit (Tfb2), putative [Cordyceps militaris CM01]EGX92992.1 TFIIH and nucleotide excision repair factor 3 complexes subunit (Tfb2), putative [Cordyceps militaris CM01]
MAANTQPAMQLADYLEKLPGTTFRKLYQQPSTAFAIFRRMLPHLAKTIVMRMLYMSGPMSLADLDAWVKPEAKRQKDQMLSTLRSLHIVQISAPAKDKTQEVQLTTNFRTSMRLALTGGGNHNSFGVPSSLTVPPEIDAPFLDRYARRRWDEILHFVVSSVGFKSTATTAAGGEGGGGGGPNKSVRDILIAGRLVDRRPSGSVGITQAGFTFLLQEANAQVWTLLLLWLDAQDADKNAAVDTLSFLFMLASLEPGRAYDTHALSEQRRDMLPALADFGLVYIPPQKRSMFFPTRLATTLTSGASSGLRSISDGVAAATSAARSSPSSSAHQPASSSAGSGPLGGGSGDQPGAVVIETNYRLYAYTQSTLQIAVLALFARLTMRFPDMVAGRLTRTSIRQAIQFGITADQIIAYLAAHAHEQMHRTAALTNKPVLPPTVVDQIRLWQLENERMKTTPGFLFRDFDDPKEYHDTRRFADEIGVLVWSDDKKGLFFASKFEQIRDYLKSRKKAE